MDHFPSSFSQARHLNPKRHRHPKSLSFHTSSLSDNKDARDSTVMSTYPHTSIHLCTPHTPYTLCTSVHGVHTPCVPIYYTDPTSPMYTCIHHSYATCTRISHIYSMDHAHTMHTPQTPCILYAHTSYVTHIKST